MGLLVKSKKNKILRRFRKVYNAAQLHGWGVALGAGILQIHLAARAWRYFFSRPLLRLNILNSKMTLDLSDPGLSWQLITRGQREVEHTKDIRTNLRSGMTGIDLGANMGYFALIEASAIGPSGHLYCIEPVSTNIEILKKNICDNGYTKRVTLSQNIIAAECGKQGIKITTASNSHHISASKSNAEKADTTEEVDATTLDRFMEKHGITPEGLDFLRCDIEGYEAIALKGMSKLLSSKSPLLLFIEFHPDLYPAWGTDMRQILTLLDRSGFRLCKAVKEFPVHDGTEPTAEILEAPSISDLLERQRCWPKGGVQAYLKRG